MHIWEIWRSKGMNTQFSHHLIAGKICLEGEEWGCLQIISRIVWIYSWVQPTATGAGLESYEINLNLIWSDPIKLYQIKKIRNLIKARVQPSADPDCCSRRTVALAPGSESAKSCLDTVHQQRGRGGEEERESQKCTKVTIQALKSTSSSCKTLLIETKTACTSKERGTRKKERHRKGERSLFGDFVFVFVVCSLVSNSSYPLTCCCEYVLSLHWTRSTRMSWLVGVSSVSTDPNHWNM